MGPESGSWSTRLEGPEQNSCHGVALWAATLPPSRNPPYVVGYECGDGVRIRLRFRPGIWFGHCPADLVPGGSESQLGEVVLANLQLGGTEAAVVSGRRGD